MKNVFLGVIGATLMALPGLSSAMPMSWTYSGTCSWGDCSDVPSISGSISADPTLWGSDDAINEYALVGDLISYSFTFGGSTYTGSSGLGSYYLDSMGNITGGSMSFGNLFTFEVVGSSSWSIGGLFADAAGGSGSYTSVPEPGTLGLFGLALLGAGLGARRRKAAK